MQQQLFRFARATVLVVALVLVGILTAQNRALRGEVREVRERAMRPHGGIYVPTFQATSLAGEPVTIGNTPGGGRQVLFVFTTTCPYCQETLPDWRAIASVIDTMPVKARAYGISLDSEEDTRRYVAANAISFPVLQFPERKLESLYRTRSVPTTIVLDSAGRIIFARQGPVGHALGIDSVYGALRWKPAEPSPISDPR